MTDYSTTIAALEHLAERGDADALTDTDPGVVFTTGGCALYATALVRANPGWTVVAAGWDTCVEYDPDEPDLRPCGDYGDNICGCKIGHFYALSPDGWLYDVYGEHDPVSIHENKGLHLIADRTLTCVLESWHYNSEQYDHDVAALAVRLTAA